MNEERTLKKKHLYKELQRVYTAPCGKAKTVGTTVVAFRWTKETKNKKTTEWTSVSFSKTLLLNT